MIQETKELVGQVKHVKLFGLCLVAVFALGVVAVSAAQAEGPEWGRCVKLAKNKGKYKDANCTQLEGKTNGKGVFKGKAKGDYEWVPGGATTCYEEPAKKGKYKDAACKELEGKTNGKGEFKAKEKGHFEKINGGPNHRRRNLARDPQNNLRSMRKGRREAHRTVLEETLRRRRWHGE